MSIRPLKKYWVCVHESGVVIHDTVARLKWISKEAFGGQEVFKKYSKKGFYRCIKVNITFEEI